MPNLFVLWGSSSDHLSTEKLTQFARINDSTYTDFASLPPQTVDIDTLMTTSICCGRTTKKNQSFRNEAQRFCVASLVCPVSSTLQIRQIRRSPLPNPNITLSDPAPRLTRRTAARSPPLPPPLPRQPGQWEALSDWWLAGLFKCSFVTISAVAEAATGTLRHLVRRGALNPRAVAAILTHTQHKHRRAPRGGAPRAFKRGICWGAATPSPPFRGAGDPQASCPASHS